MGNRKHIDLIRQGVTAWNEWRVIHKRSQPDLTRADLSGMDLRGVDLRGAGLFKANLRGANLSGATLRQARLIETDLRDADLSGCHVYGVATWDLQLDGARQTGLNIAKPGQPKILVDDIEVAQVLYLLLNARQVRKVLHLMAQRGVLLLGRFNDGGLEMLRQVADALRDMHYAPIIFDFDAVETRDQMETVTVLAGLSRHVIADLSGPSVPAELQAIVTTYRVPVIPLIQRGTRPYALFKILHNRGLICKPIDYSSVDDILRSLSASLCEAEDLLPCREAFLGPAPSMPSERS
ncbi:pentapeptide repeat-containing protein [Azospirillum sp. B21]|uniref:pentapeptide repeat-containing protein n=1 Tax=Azospirillum sp. B21 TaxID=2607496 RepID=UPI00165F94FE|nr:pentapeptide repeat-containing protein [Azospirillum sp. B21]